MNTPYPHLELLAMPEYKPRAEKTTVTVTTDAELAAIRARVKAKQNG